VTGTVVTHVDTRRLTLGFDRFERLDLDRHRAVHGRLHRPRLARLITMAERVDLRGRGGAAFPFAHKLRAVGRHIGGGVAVVVNAAEGEPGSAKDQVLLTRAPHLVLDGAIVVAHALRSREVVVAVTGNGPAGRSIRAASGERDFPVRVVELPERFIAGESGAVIRALNGDAPLPPGRGSHASDSGVGGRPTLLSNAETFAQLALLTSLGVDLYASVGTRAEPGTVLLTVAGTTVVEVPLGTPLGTVLERCGTPAGQGVLVGGYHGTWLEPSAASHAPVSRAGLAAAGGTLGAGVVLPLAPGTCPLGEVARIGAYLVAESAGQCGPCRLGLPAVVRALSALADGTRGPQAVREAVAIGQGRGACSHPDGTARFVLSALEVFRRDLALHETGGGCGLPVRALLPLPAQGTTRLAVDWTRCEGHGLCAHLAPELIRLDRDGYPVVLASAIPAWAERDARRAVSMCPSLALRLAPGNLPTTERT
jgi:NADH:ubiquinone oxidoreductase subunit F (NADH-binding)/ferredoxin